MNTFTRTENQTAVAETMPNEADHLSVRDMRLARRFERLHKTGDYVTYAIIDPVAGPFYVGQTSQVERRIRQHLKKPSAKVRQRLVDMQADGRSPLFEILERTTTRAEAEASETRWINQFAADGHLLLNCYKLRGTALYRRKRRGLSAQRTVAPRMLR